MTIVLIYIFMLYFVHLIFQLLMEHTWMINKIINIIPASLFNTILIPITYNFNNTSFYTVDTLVF